MREEGQMSWYVVNHDHNDAVVRGPYSDSSTAAAVRRELERTEHYVEKNLWIVAKFVDSGLIETGAVD